MNLHFSPLACSLASRIALYEANAAAQYTQVERNTKRLPDGSNFLELSRMGQVPLLLTDAGEVLTENTAILQYLADSFPEAGLAPSTRVQRAQLQKWLGFIGTELHKAVFAPLLDRNAPVAVKEYTLQKVALRFGVLQDHLAQRDYLLDAFSVADAYLFTVLNWVRVTPIDLAQWPAVHAYQQRMLQRPSIAKAFGEEYAMYQREQTTQAA
jgi:glutathione S-transferase